MCVPTTSPIYKFPSPTPAELSDGPANFTALGARIEREMGAYRGYTFADREVTAGIGVLPTYTLVHSSDHAVAIIGWVDVNAEIAIGTFNPVAADGSVVNIAGQWRLLANGTQIAAGRWHNYGFTKLIRCNLAGSHSLPAATTNVTIRVEIAADTLSGPAYTMYSGVMVRRYGAPAD
jgi:hypothetical protein